MPILTRTTKAIQILNNVYLQTTSLLNAFNASKAGGHAQLEELFEQIRDDLNDAKKRSETETIRLGILGGRGSGKSSLANALMGDSYLPESAIIFCTSLPTTIKYSGKNYLRIESELQEYSYEGLDISNSDIKNHLRKICKESENPNNEKKISKIIIGLPQGILDGKEIVDLPGFTKGNPLHQAFAERYAKHYCDVCLVLLRNIGCQVSKLSQF
jgi:energy-coupling factor transporter ATP-binding protein EcfA2